VDTEKALKSADRHFGGIASGPVPPRMRTVEPEQIGERRVLIRRQGTAAYFKAAYHAPGAGDPDFLPLLVLDAVLTGAKGVNLWSSFRVAPPQRSARLYRGLVDLGLASTVSGSLVPTAEPFLYTISATATDGTPLASVESALLAALDEVRRSGITGAELARAKAQLRARLVFDGDSVTNIAHQIGYFETIASVDVFTGLAGRLASVTLEQVAAASARLFGEARRTVGWFDPQPDRGET
jgi:zinc protease